MCSPQEVRKQHSESLQSHWASWAGCHVMTVMCGSPSLGGMEPSLGRHSHLFLVPKPLFLDKLVYCDEIYHKAMPTSGLVLQPYPIPPLPPNWPNSQWRRAAALSTYIHPKKPMSTEDYSLLVAKSKPTPEPEPRRTGTRLTTTLGSENPKSMSQRHPATPSEPSEDHPEKPSLSLRTLHPSPSSSSQLP